MAIATHTLASLDDLARLPADEIIDVRSPAEFAEDHLPGAINLPVLDDAERARVGTIYKQQSPFLARKVGAALVAANAARHLLGPLADRPGGWRPVLYCWRGGQRSGSFATILDQIGWRVGVIAGGYRSYRRLVAAATHDAPFPAPVFVLDGNTGTAKTALLGHLAARGVQVLDLEGLARHRGSLFGAVAGGQPGQKAFEGAIAAAARALDPARPVVVEAESSRIGTLGVPPSLWAAMIAAPRIEIAAPLAARAAFLVRAYGDICADRAALAATIDALRPWHAGEVIEGWHKLAAAGEDAALAAELMARHYDPRYRRHRDRMPAAAEVLALPDLSPATLEAAAARIAARLGEA